MIFGIRKMYYFDPYNVYLAIAKKYTPATEDWFCGPGSYFWFTKKEPAQKSHSFMNSSTLAVYVCLNKLSEEN